MFSFLWKNNSDIFLNAFGKEMVFEIIESKHNINLNLHISKTKWHIFLLTVKLSRFLQRWNIRGLAIILVDSANISWVKHMHDDLRPKVFFYKGSILVVEVTHMVVVVFELLETLATNTIISENNKNLCIYTHIQI